MTKNIRRIVIVLLAAMPFTAGADNWMGRLPDNRPLCEMSIPGTHDAATGGGFQPSDTLLGNLIGRTQELSIASQWAVGIRAFDLRPAVMTDKNGRQTLHVFHGEFATRSSFADILSLLRDSLRSNPTECAVIVMRHESSPSRDEHRWAALMDSTLATFADVLIPFRPGLTLGDMRGHILLLSRDRYADVPRGGYITDWHHEADLASQREAVITGPATSGDKTATSCPLWVQDFYDTSATDGVKTKIEAISRMLGASSSMRPLMAQRHIWVINHTSGYCKTAKGYGPEPVSLTEGYRANAAATNAALIKMLGKNKRKQSAGIVMMDFGGVDRSANYKVEGLRLVRKIIALNAAD